jgi:hypothetical protein
MYRGNASCPIATSGIQPGPCAEQLLSLWIYQRKLTEHVCTTGEELLSAIITIFSEMEKEALLAVFTSWIKRVRWVMKHQGEYYHK